MHPKGVLNSYRGNLTNRDINISVETLVYEQPKLMVVFEGCILATMRLFMRVDGPCERHNLLT